MDVDIVLRETSLSSFSNVYHLSFIEGLRESQILGALV